MKSLRKLAVVGLLVVVWAGATACPPGSGPGIGPEFIEIAARYEILSGLTLLWYKDRAMRDPGRILLGPLPAGLEFNGFQSYSGKFFINLDETTPNDFEFKIIAEDALNACVDFAANSQCDPDDILIRYLDPQRTIEVLNPYGNQVVSMGTYGMRWQNDVLSVQYGTQNDGLFEVPLRMERGEQFWEINLMFGVNTYFFPHLPVGRGNGYGVEPRFQWTNPTGSLNETWTHLYTQTGAPMTVSVGETQEDEFDREVDAKLAEILDLDYDQPFQIGWGFTYARRPLQAQLVYRTYGLPQEEEGGGASPSGAPSQVVPEVIAEAGITASQLNTCHIIGVRKEGKSDTGVAIVNPTSKTATIRLTLKDREGEVVATRTGQLASMNQTVGFFHQLLEQELTAFSGTLTIFSDTTLAATALNTVGGLQSSSLVSATANDR